MRNWPIESGRYVPFHEGVCDFNITYRYSQMRINSRFLYALGGYQFNPGNAPSFMHYGRLIVIDETIPDGCCFLS